MVANNPNATLTTRTHFQLRIMIINVLTGLKQFPTIAHEEKPPPMNIEGMFRNFYLKLMLFCLETWCVIGSSFYMAVILSSIVFEKEYRQRYLMKMVLFGIV